MEPSSSSCTNLFKTGRLLATPGAESATKDAGIGLGTLLERHMSGDWGDVCEEDAETTQAALDHGSRLMSVYKLSTGKEVWIITEADRSSTTFLMPDEY